MSANKKRVSKISKSISRTYNVAKFESLVVQVSFEDEIEWETLEERKRKSDNITKLLINDFEVTKVEAFKELDVELKNAYFKDIN